MTKKNQIIFFLLITFLILISSSNNSIELELNQIKRGSLKNNEYDYYILTLPNKFDKESYLIVELEPYKELDVVNNIISDPNLYISMTEKKPSIQSNTWKSERFGDETISINPSYLNPEENFYIAVYCKEKCNYKLKTQLVKDIIIKDNEMNNFNLNPHTVTKYSFTTRNDFNELYVNIAASYINSFNAYLSKENPSSSNTLNSTPILFNGYRFTIPKYNNLKQLNTNTQYNLIIDNDKDRQDLKIWLQYDNEKILIEEADILYDSIDENKAHCYYYAVDYFNKNKDIIISTTLYNGEGFIYIAGFSSIKPESININDKNKNSYKVIQSKALKLTKDNFNTYGKFNENEQNFLNFCFYAEKSSSLSLKVYFLENYKRFQALNTIYAGIEIEDIIPKYSLKKYKLEHFDIEQDLSIYLIENSGKPKLYLYMEKPEEQNIILGKQDFERFKKNKQVIEANHSYNSYYLLLTKELNKCIKDPKTNVNLCYLNAVVECDGEEDCNYNIEFDHSKTVFFLQPKTIYSNVISENEEDYYKIIISDESIKHLVIVLMQNTGKTLLRLESFTSEVGGIDLNEEIQNNEFLPNLIRISNEKLNIDNLKGTFRLIVKGLSYASYSLYYYTFIKEENEDSLDQDKVSMKLEKGRIIRDIFMDNHRFKVYMYDTTIIGQKPNLYIGLVETDYSNLELYVFKDLNDFSIFNENISGYLWSGDYKDYIYIDKDDKNYINNDVLYILVFKKESYIRTAQKDVYSTFYLGVTDENCPFLLYEGIEFKYQLYKEHNSQKFYYYFIDDDKDEEQDLQISLSLFYGHAIVKIKIDNNDYNTNYILEESSLITIKREDIYKFCKKNNNCGIEIEVKNEDSFLEYSSFLIAVKSAKNSPIYLKQGLISKRTILTGEDQYFIVNIKPDDNFGAKISATFTNAKGEIYIRKALRNEMFKLKDFPNEKNYEYKVTYLESKNDFYLIEIPKKDFNDNSYNQFLITVRGIFPGYFYTKIEYSIFVSSSIYDIITDKNYRLFLAEGEMSFFHFRIGNHKKRLYISITNKEKETNVFLSNTQMIKPIYEFEWKISGGYNQYLDISINDSHFVERGLRDLDGDYFLVIQGIEDTFYNLYISTQDVKIMTLTEGYPGGCYCEYKNDVCYFRYENLNNYQDENIYEKKMIFYTDFTYGSASLQAKLYPNGNMEEIIKNLPNEKNNDIFKDDDSEFLFMKINKENPKFTLNSVIVIGAQCKEKSLFDLSAVLLDKFTDITRNENDLIFLQLNQDNIFYLSPVTGKKTKFCYYITDDEDILFHVKALNGITEIHTYTNYTEEEYYYMDYESRKNVKQYYHISDFSLESNKKDNNEYFGKVPKYYGYHNFFYIEVKPKIDCLLNININYDNEITQIPLNKEVIKVINNNEFNAYYVFDLNIEEIILTVTSLDSDNQYYVHLKTDILNKNSSIAEKKNTKASSKKYDIRGKTNELTSAIFFLIKNVPKKKRSNYESVRILINILPIYHTYNNKIKVLITPVINNILRIKPDQKKYYFSNIDNNFSEKVVFNLNNINPENDLMIIEISSCKGDFLYTITDTPPLDTETYDQLQKRKISSDIYSSNGKKIITIINLEIKEYYLTIFDSNNNQENDIHINKREKNIVDVLFYYYTTNKKLYNYLVTNDSLIYKTKNTFSSIKLFIPELKKRDVFGKENYADSMNYTFIISDQKKDLLYMESTCYLTKMIQNNAISKYNLNIDYDKTNNAIDVKGLESGKTYYINILGKNTQTGEVITYKPLTIVFSSVTSSIKIFVIIILVIALIIFLYIAFTIYRKYRIKKMQLKFIEENNNIDNSFKNKNNKTNNINMDFITKNEDDIKLNN